MTPRRSLPWLLVLMLGAPPGGVRAQEPETVPVIPTDGTEVFCWVLKSHHFNAAETIAELRSLRQKKRSSCYSGGPGYSKRFGR